MVGGQFEQGLAQMKFGCRSKRQGSNTSDYFLLRWGRSLFPGMHHERLESGIGVQ